MTPFIYLKEQYSKYKDWIQLALCLISTFAIIGKLPDYVWTEQYLLQPLSVKVLTGSLLLLLLIAALFLLKILEQNRKISKLESPETPEESAALIKERTKRRLSIIGSFFSK